MEESDIKKIELEYAINHIHEPIKSWGNARKNKILRILKKQGIQISLENIPEIIRQTSFYSMDKKCSDINKDKECQSYCNLIGSGKSCHPEIKDLNCFLCDCPNYDTEFLSNKTNSQDYQILIGRCLHKDNKGKYYFSKEFPRVGVWDCDICPINHDPLELEKYLRTNLQSLKEAYDNIILD
ncbi:MAG: hypothetical protein WC867_00115 [Candidatus Pacearchaeota archaeon]|jgi:hypothetical protein